MNPEPNQVREQVKVSDKKPEPAGQQVTVESEKEFLQICKNLTSNFQGLMRLSGEVDDQSYTVGLLVREGLVEAVSFEHMDTVELTYGDGALNELKQKFSGVKGDLKIYALTGEDFEKAGEASVAAILTQPVKLTSLNLTLKSRVKPKTRVKEKKGIISKIFPFGRGKKKIKRRDQDDRIKEARRQQIQKIKVESDFSLTNFARQIKGLDPFKQKRFEQLRAVRKKEDQSIEKPTIIDEAKKIRLQQLKMQRHLRDSKLKIDLKSEAAESDGKGGSIPAGMPGDDKKEVMTPKSPREGETIKTSIDELYKIVEKRKQVKITDALARKLQVSKTQIEEWAMILEEHDLLQLHYPTIGEPVIIAKGQSSNGRK